TKTPSPVCVAGIMCFFFTSRRRHTRCYRDWSSDVCSSDLSRRASPSIWTTRGPWPSPPQPCSSSARSWHSSDPSAGEWRSGAARSEERRVGKEWRSRRSKDEVEENNREEEMSYIGRISDLH